MTDESYIRLKRKIMKHEWYQNANTAHLFNYLLLRANHTVKKWQGHTLQRGQLVTSLKHISRDTGLSIQSVRTCLERLEATENIVRKSTNKNTLITVCTYDSYVLPVTNEQQTSNKQTTNEQQQTITNKNLKKYIPFSDFWILYDKKVNREKTELLWNELTVEQPKQIMQHVPKYKKATPDKQFRLNPDKYLLEKRWQDEIPHDKTGKVNLSELNEKR